MLTFGILYVGLENHFLLSAGVKEFTHTLIMLSYTFIPCGTHIERRA